MYEQRVGIAAIEERAMEAVISPLLDEIDRFRGYCEEWKRQSELGPQTQRCPDPECSIQTVGSGYKRCPKCNGALEPSA